MYPSTFLQFSGGKDSLACLYLLKPRWHEITVAWVNTGAAFPETIEQMEQVREMVPHFLEIKGQQNIAQEGFPVDILPIRTTRLAQLYEGQTKRTFQSRYTCCSAAIWFPLDQAMRYHGAQVVIRGQKNCDPKKSTVESGSVVNGIRYEFPISDWSNADVMAYLKELQVPLPRNYPEMMTSLDCWNCTAYRDENGGKLPYMEKYHPQKHYQVATVLNDLIEEINAYWRTT